jgi:hypothetical protein
MNLTRYLEKLAVMSEATAKPVPYSGSALEMDGPAGTSRLNVCQRAQHCHEFFIAA